VPRSHLAWWSRRPPIDRRLTSTTTACGGRWLRTGSPQEKSPPLAEGRRFWEFVGHPEDRCSQRIDRRLTSSCSLQRVLFAERRGANGQTGRKRRSAVRSGTGRPTGMCPGPEAQRRLRRRDEGNGDRWGSLHATRRFGTAGWGDRGPGRNPLRTSSEESARTVGARSARRWRSVWSRKGLGREETARAIERAGERLSTRKRGESTRR
jgi:hypothetical protein